MKSRLARVVICVGCLYHLAAMVMTNMPTTTAFGGELFAPFRHYVVYAGLWQSWTMFHTVPNFRAIRPKLVARYDDGAESVHGAMLPGLTPYQSRTRMASLFLRYTWPTPDIQPYLRGYLARACTAVEAESGRKPRTMTMRLESIRLRPLAKVRETGAVGERSFDLSASEPCR